MKRIFRLLLAALVLITGILAVPGKAEAAEATDEILNFTITVDVNEDATLNMRYHIEWKVLDDVVYGPLTDVNIGLPNSHHSRLKAESSTVASLKDNGSAVSVILDRKYYKNEVVSFDFSLVQDHMYQVGRYAEGETAFIFSPAWFDGIDVDLLTIRWNKDKAGAWQPDCYVEGDYLVFEATLDAGERYQLTVAYPNDAFLFDTEKQIEGGGYEGGSDDDVGFFGMVGGLALAVLGIAAVVLMFVAPVLLIGWLLSLVGGKGSGFGSTTETEKKITRTKIIYFENCPGCGMAHVDGEDNCSYCGHTMIKSKEVVEEKDIEKPERYSTAGTFRYGSDPNTFIRVNVVNVPITHTTTTTRTRSSGHFHSSCVSSCASACASSCACASHCACACACASSGRAGCSVKNFFDQERYEKNLRVDSKEQVGT